MSKFAFRISVAVLVMTILALLSVIGKQSPEALANLPQQNSQQSDDRDRLATKMLDPVVHRADRMHDLCIYLNTAAVQLRMESLVPLSTCEGIRTAKNDAVARIRRMVINGTDDDVRVASRSIDQFMIESAASLRTMEESYATVSRIMREAAR